MAFGSELSPSRKHGHEKTVPSGMIRSFPLKCTASPDAFLRLLFWRTLRRTRLAQSGRGRSTDGRRCKRFGNDPEVLLCGQVFVKRGRFDQRPDLAENTLCGRFQLFAEKNDLPLRRLQQAGDHSDRCRLSGAVSSRKAVNSPSDSHSGSSRAPQTACRIFSSAHPFVKAASIPAFLLAAEFS